MTLPVTACPCGKLDRKKRVLAYADCCGRFIETSVPAPDAAHLMRSRYSAFVLERADYLLATWHRSTRPTSLRFEAGAKWLGLEVRAHALTSANTAEVAFVARYRVHGQATRMQERSRFVCEGEPPCAGDAAGGVEGGARWFYVDGELA